MSERRGSKKKRCKKPVIVGMGKKSARGNLGPESKMTRKYRLPEGGKRGGGPPQNPNVHPGGGSPKHGKSWGGGEALLWGKKRLKDRLWW